MSKPRIAFLNRCYWPDAEATGQLLEDLCQSLSKSWDVTVVAGQPNSNPTGALYQRVGTQVHAGITIDRLPHTTFNKRKKLGRLANLASFTNQARRWGARRQQRERPFDIIVSETDPFFLPMISASMAKSMNAKYVAYVQDVYPDIAVALGVVKEGMVTRQIRKRLKNAYLNADRIIVLDEDMRDRLSAWGIAKDRFAIVPNWVDTTLVHPVKQDNPFRKENAMDDLFVVMHSGNMGMSQRLERLIDAACHPNWPDSAIVALVGDGARRKALEEYAAIKSAKHVRFFDYQPRDRLAESLSAADLHVISMDSNIRGCLAPSKLYGILASGTPVLAIVPQGCDLARVVMENQVGLAIPPNDIESIVRHVGNCVSNLSEQVETQNRARQLAISKYDRSVCCAQFEEVIDGVTNEK